MKLSRSANRIYCNLRQARGLHKKPDFTINNFQVQRKKFNHLTNEHVDAFKHIIGGSQTITENLDKYNVDWFGALRGNSPLVLKPKTTHELSQLLEYCNKNRLAVCPQGGHTGCVGAGTPVFDEIVLSMESMNKILSFDENSGILVCEAGCILETINNFLLDQNFIFPLDLGAKGSCQIGGNVATNAGGLRVLKYGNLHGNVLGLEVVQANGSVLDLLSTLKKDNTGYHLKNIFIGSEGTLGIITKVAVMCRQRPTSTNVALLGLQSFTQILKTFRKSKVDLDETLTAFEVVDFPSMALVTEKLGLESPIGEYPYYVLIETTGSREQHDQEKLEQFLQTCFQKNLVLNGTFTGDPGKLQSIWALRERIPEAFSKDGHVFMYDISLPLQYYYQMVDDVRKHMGNLSHRVFGFGHLGDGNLHLQISVERFDTQIVEYMEPYVIERTKHYNGSISAEHGMGFLKAKYLPLVKSPNVVNLMLNIKDTMDPNGILNPYKVMYQQ